MKGSLSIQPLGWKCFLPKGVVSLSPPKFLGNPILKLNSFDRKALFLTHHLHFSCGQLAQQVRYSTVTLHAH